MGFAEDKVYDYILKNLKNFKNIRVASLADSLSCLTDADRDELHTREEMRGSQATVYKFYQYLKCRQGWVPDLIEALRQNNAGHLADELQHVYDSWQARAPAPTTASLPLVASDARPAVSSISVQTPSLEPNPAPGAPLAEKPCRDLPVSSQPPLLPGAATAVSMDLDARAPVQESLPKALDQESPRPPPLGSVVCDGVSDGHGEERHLSHPIEAAQAATETSRTASAAMPSAAPPEGARDWLSHQQHPVCVRNGCFGNANHLHRGVPGLGLSRSLPLRDACSARSPEQPRNEPEENFYVSTESPLVRENTACSGGPQPTRSLPKSQAVPGPEYGETLGSFLDVRSPLLIQEQFDAEQKLGRMHRGVGDTWMESATLVATPAPGDASPSCNTSAKPPVQEEKLSMGEATGSTPSVPTKEKVLPALADPFLGTAVVGSFEGVTGRTPSRVSSATSIWAPCSNMERDVELSKPGVLSSVAGESPEAAGRCLSTREPSGPYSGGCSLTFNSDPLLVSTDSSSSGGMPSRVPLVCPAPVAPEDPSEEEAAGASRDSLSPLSWDSTSLGTHEVRVDHNPSTQLGAGNDLQDGAISLGNSPVFDSSRGPGTATSSSQARAPPGDDGPPLQYIIPAVGIAVISAVAFLVYTRLQK
ncbi:PREDICTED: mitochondrial antiviral-signaling protein [Eurypyga helias]|uniref:mitochondrial antiviral-signaling protein n=1 Tax=Eurypyga helias TaxID=54383 RepID=UPI000528148E|nr:PREDICTED: mitochondrial antiviral-signaling protein [Eurypyga helias]KFV90139.1 Mitochondrial antiviral-signaling protein [Eurypyga helias]